MVHENFLEVYGIWTREFTILEMISLDRINYVPSDDPSNEIHQAA